MNLIITLLISFLSLHYSLLIISLIIGIRKLRNRNYCKSENANLTFSIIICARNESQNLNPLLESLTKLTYPKHRYEIILVNDGSSDNTKSIIFNFTKQFDNWKLINIKKNDTHLKGKMNALDIGVKSSKHDIILLTDADCVVQSNWIQEIGKCFDNEVGVVIGNSPNIQLETNKSIKLIINDFINLCNSIIYAGSTAVGKPYSCSGRNFAYRKLAFFEVNGFHQVSKYFSGDDILMLKLILSNTAWKAKYCISEKSYTYTMPKNKLKGYVNQQKRRLGKTFYHNPFFITLSLLIFMFYLINFCGLFFPKFFLLSLSALAFTIFLEILLFIQGAFLFKKRSLIRYIPLMMFVYPLHTLFFGIWGNLTKAKWKS